MFLKKEITFKEYYEYIFISAYVPLVLFGLTCGFWCSYCCWKKCCRSSKKPVYTEGSRGCKIFLSAIMVLIILAMVIISFFGLSYTGKQQDYILEFKCDVAKSVSDLIYGAKDFKS